MPNARTGYRCYYLPRKIRYGSLHLLHLFHIIPGKGTGALRKAVHDILRRNKAVKSFRLGVYGEGEDGVTIAELA